MFKISFERTVEFTESLTHKNRKIHFSYFWVKTLSYSYFKWHQKFELLFQNIFWSKFSSKNFFQRFKSMFQCISRTICSSVHLRPMFIFTIQKPVHYFSFFMEYLYFPPPDPLLGPQSWPQICIYWPWTPICIYRPWHQICVYQPSPLICIYRPWPPICIYWF